MIASARLTPYRQGFERHLNGVTESWYETELSKTARSIYPLLKCGVRHWLSAGSQVYPTRSSDLSG
jgi:hypothetical protein